MLCLPTVISGLRQYSYQAIFNIGSLEKKKSTCFKIRSSFCKYSRYDERKISINTFFAQKLLKEREKI